MRLAANRPVSNPSTRAATPAAPAKAPVVAPNVIDADLGLRLTPGGLVAGSGDVVLNRVFVERFIRRLTQNRKPIQAAAIAFDPSTGTYAGSATLTVKGMALNLVGRARPVVSDNQPGFRFDDLGLRLGPVTLRHPLLTRFATRKLAEEIGKSGIHATAAPDGIVRFEPTSLLQKIKAIPSFARIDSVATRLGVTVAPNGDVTFRGRTEGVEGRSTTPQSDILLTSGVAEVLDALAPLLQPSYELKGVTFGNGTITLDGLAEVGVVSNVVNAGKLLASLLLLTGGYPPGDLRGTRATIPLKLEVKVTGTRAVMTPSTPMAIPQLEAMLAKLNANPRRVGDTVQFDLRAIAGRMGLEDVRVTPGRLEARARLDIPSLIKSPALRGEA